MARTKSSAHDASSAATAIPNPASQSRIAVVRSKGGMYRAVDLVGVPVEDRLAALESLLGVDTFGHTEDVPGTKLPRPAAQPVQVLFLLVELGRR